MAFAVEEQLSENLEALHISIGPRDRQHRYPLMVTQRDRFQALLALLTTQGIDVRAVHVDADLLAGDQAIGVRWFGLCRSCRRLRSLDLSLRLNCP
ncbi:type II secretion system protein GspL [Pseudomonas brassicacearum]|uniref:type II secretion system protein GspL n=1 Tax=Pseudomonas brassicacearum TaxID=930166 RepID=UPI00299F5F07|nr:type II secretion system protein GspL [Pseudomonas brassicacearum]